MNPATLALARRGFEGLHSAWRGVPNDGEKDATAALRSAVAEAVAVGKPLTIDPGMYRLSDTLDATGLVGLHLAAGAELVQHADAPIITVTGSYGEALTLPAPVVAGHAGFEVDAGDLASLAVGDWLLIYSSDVIPDNADGKTTTRGCIRQVRSLTAPGTVAVEEAFYAGMSTNVRARKLTLAKCPRFTGPGALRYATHYTQKEGDFIRLTFTQDVALSGWRLHTGASTGVRLTHCVGGAIDGVRIDDLLNDPDQGRYGYGIDLAGATRDIRITPQTTISRCRTGVTTTTGTFTATGQLPAELRGRGEPEACWIGPRTENMASNHLGTHTEGWGLTFAPNIHGGSAGGVLICAEGCTVDGGSIQGVRGDGITVHARVAACIIRAPRIIGHYSAGGNYYGVRNSGRSVLNAPYIHGFAGVGVYNDGDLSVEGGMVDGVNNLYRGVHVAPGATRTRITGLTITRCYHGVYVTDGAPAPLLTGATLEGNTFDFGYQSAASERVTPALPPGVTPVLAYDATGEPEGVTALRLALKELGLVTDATT